VFYHTKKLRNTGFPISGPFWRKNFLGLLSEAVDAHPVEVEYLADGETRGHFL
jgi:hypothetical protein